MIGDLVLARMRDQGNEALEEHEWIEDERTRPVPPRLAQVPDHLAVVAHLQATQRESRASDVSTEMLQ